MIRWRVLDGGNRPLGEVLADVEGFALQRAVRQWGEDVAKVVPLTKSPEAPAEELEPGAVADQ
ncbi:MAG: hypothetical protein AB7R55_14730 [Gemmatimonadales bacterium]